MKLLLGLLLVVGVSLSSLSAQTPMTVTSASYSNTGADTANIKVTSSVIATIQPVITKVSGTVAGKAFIWVSVNGTNYTKLTNDSLVLSNQTTNTKMFPINPSLYPYYRVIVTGSGTMVASFKSWVYGR